jgi:hypothetical protein
LCALSRCARRIAQTPAIFSCAMGLVDLWHELATAVEQSLRETLDGEPTRAVKATA